jgi:hypothetical protein
MTFAQAATADRPISYRFGGWVRPNGTCFCHAFACHATVTVVVKKR